MQYSRRFDSHSPIHPRPRGGGFQSIYEDTWCVIDVRIAFHRYPTQYQAHIRALGWQTRALLGGDRGRWATDTGAAVESLLASNPPLVKKSLHQMRVCYKESVNRSPPHSHITTASMNVERIALYTSVTPPPPRREISSVDRSVPH